MNLCEHCEMAMLQDRSLVGVGVLLMDFHDMLRWFILLRHCVVMPA